MYSENKERRIPKSIIQKYCNKYDVLSNEKLLYLIIRLFFYVY